MIPVLVIKVVVVAGLVVLVLFWLAYGIDKIIPPRSARRTSR